MWDAAISVCAVIWLHWQRACIGGCLVALHGTESAMVNQEFWHRLWSAAGKQVILWWRLVLGASIRIKPLNAMQAILSS
jgi:hypothetical protein